MEFLYKYKLEIIVSILQLFLFVLGLYFYNL